MLEDALNEIKTINPSWLGLMEYEQALEAQLRIAERVRQGETAHILALHHEPVVTLGKRAQALDDLLVGMDVLRQNKIKIVATDRGGQATLHNPGQLVLYPIFPIQRWRMGVRQYVECLERTTAYFLADYGVEVTRSYEPGLWVQDKKIASFGIRVHRGVTLHGVAINIFNNLQMFSLIKQCGRVVEATSLENEMKLFMIDAPELKLHEMANQWMNQFRNVIEEMMASEDWVFFEAPQSSSQNPSVN